VSDAPAPAAALGYSVVVNLDGNRQLTMQCFVAEDEPNEAVNAKLDRIFAVIDRQKARYDLVNEHEELSKESTMLAQLEEDLARVDADFEKAQASLKAQGEEISAQQAALVEAGYNEHVNSGRRGEYQPRGVTQQGVKATQVALENVTAELKKNEAERDQHRQGVLISIDRYKKAIAERTSRIGGLEKLMDK
jgi:hypothetical protein